MTSKLLMRDNRPVHFSWARSIVESATIKGLAPRLCFWTRRLRGKRLRRSDDDLCTPLTLIAKSSKHENAKQPHWAQARSSCWGTRSPPL